MTACYNVCLVLLSETIAPLLIVLKYVAQGKVVYSEEAQFRVNILCIHIQDA